MTIESKTIYITRGQQFDTFRSAVMHRENLVEAFLRKLPGFEHIPAKSRIAFVTAILQQRDDLISLLQYSDKPDEEDDSY